MTTFEAIARNPVLYLFAAVALYAIARLVSACRRTGDQIDAALPSLIDPPATDWEAGR